MNKQTERDAIEAFRAGRRVAVAMKRSGAPTRSSAGLAELSVEQNARRAFMQSRDDFDAQVMYQRRAARAAA